MRDRKMCARAKSASSCSNDSCGKQQSDHGAMLSYSRSRDPPGARMRKAVRAPFEGRSVKHRHCSARARWYGRVLLVFFFSCRYKTESYQASCRAGHRTKRCDARPLT